MAWPINGDVACCLDRRARGLASCNGLPVARFTRSTVVVVRERPLAFWFRIDRRERKRERVVGIMNYAPNEISGANAGGRDRFRFPASWAARIAHFCRWANR